MGHLLLLASLYNGGLLFGPLPIFNKYPEYGEFTLLENINGITPNSIQVEVKWQFTRLVDEWVLALHLSIAGNSIHGSGLRSAARSID